VGDSIPNIFSPENCIAIKQRQNAATVGRVADFTNPKYQDRFVLNEKLIDLSFIPNDITFSILREYAEQLQKPKGKLLFYLTSHGLDKLTASLQDF